MRNEQLFSKIDIPALLAGAALVLFVDCVSALSFANSSQVRRIAP